MNNYLDDFFKRVFSTVKNFFQHFIKCLITHYLRNYLISDISFHITGKDQVEIRNVEVNLKNIGNLPFKVKSCKMSCVKFKILSMTRINIYIIDFEMQVSICDVDTSKKDDTNEISQEIFSTENNDKVIINDDYTESIKIITEFITDLVNGSFVYFTNVKLGITTALDFTSDEKKHLMVATLEQVEITTNTLHMENLKFYVCYPMETLVVDKVCINKTKTEIVCDFEDAKKVKLLFCADSYFILSLFLGMFIENQNKISQVLQKDFIDKNKLKETLLSQLDMKFSQIQEKQETQEIEKPKPRYFKLVNASLFFTFFQKSDLKKTRLLTEKTSFKFSQVNIESDISKETIQVDIQNVSSTFGFIQDPIKFTMKKVGENYWDVYLNIPQVNITTSQNLVNNMIVFLNFNDLFTEYDILYSQKDIIKFRNVIIDDCYFVFNYVNTPINYKNILKGKWLHLFKMIPPCDIDITFPKTILKYHTGWESVTSAYTSLIFNTQKVRALKKVVVGVAKKKWKDFFTDPLL